jgi:hypothetical protein
MHEQAPKRPEASPLAKWRIAVRILDYYKEVSGPFAIAVRLLDHFNRRTGRCNPSYATLANDTGMTTRHAMRCVRTLERDGFLIVTRKGNGNTNSFDFHWARDGAKRMKKKAKNEGDIDVTMTSEPPLTPISGESGLESQKGCDIDVTQICESSINEFKQGITKVENKDSEEADEQELVNLIKAIDGIESSEFVSLRKKDEHSASVAVDRCFMAVSALTPREIIPYLKQIPPAVMRAVIKRCITGTLDVSTITRVATAIGMPLKSNKPDIVINSMA